MSNAICTGCRAPIRWIKTRAGKAMPCDPERLSEWVTDAPVTTRQKIALQDPDGDLHSGYIATVLTPAAREISGYRPHWASCPKAEQFRKEHPT